MQSHFEKPNSAVFNSISEVFYFTLFLTKNEDEEKRQAVYAHHRRARDVFIRVLTSKHKAGTLTNAQLTMILSRWLFEHDLYGESLRANLKKRLEVVPVILGNDIRYKDQFLRDLVRIGQPRHLNGTDDYSWFLDQLGNFDHPATKSIVTWAKRHRHSW